MSEITLILVLQIKTSKFFNDMAKVSKKSEKITAFGEIFFVLDIFDSILSSVIDSHLGLRSMLIGYLENRDGNANVRFMQARPDGTSTTGFAQYHRTSNPLKLNRYDIHFHRSHRVPIGLRWRRSAYQALQPQGVV